MATFGRHCLAGRHDSEQTCTDVNCGCMCHEANRDGWFDVLHESASWTHVADALVAHLELVIDKYVEVVKRPDQSGSPSAAMTAQDNLVSFRTAIADTCMSAESELETLREALHNLAEAESNVQAAREG